MIRVLIPLNEEFNKYKNECRTLYVSVQDKIKDDSSFEFICKNTMFFLFLDDEKLIGAIYYFLDDDNKLFLNGFANRKMHHLCLQCLNLSLSWFTGKIYAEAQNRASALCLLKCGFKRENGNLFAISK